MGCRQVARHRFLVTTYEGSIPSTPVITSPEPVTQWLECASDKREADSSNLSRFNIIHKIYQVYLKLLQEEYFQLGKYLFSYICCKDELSVNLV